ncbi:MAG: hypothetical protein ABJD11_09905 [Gemmatimonadota bacterium]
MFRAILYTQWKWARLAILPLVVASFAVPLLSVQAATSSALNRFQMQDLLLLIQGYGICYPLLAVAAGLALATTAWASDQRKRHVYALSLPVARWHFAGLRLLAGLSILVLPVLAVWVGALLATNIATLPAGLEIYPTLLTLRFLLAALVAYSVFFAISASSIRTAGIILGILALLLLAQLFLVMADVHVNFLGTLLERLFLWPGPFEVFTGRWMLIDV